MAGGYLESVRHLQGLSRSPWRIGTLKYLEIKIEEWPSRAKWGQSGPNGAKWCQMMPNRVKRGQMGSNGAKLGQKGPYGENVAKRAKQRERERERFIKDDIVGI